MVFRGIFIPVDLLEEDQLFVESVASISINLRAKIRIAEESSLFQERSASSASGRLRDISLLRKK